MGATSHIYFYGDGAGETLIGSRVWLDEVTLTYDWTIPANVVATDCRLRIEVEGAHPSCYYGFVESALFDVLPNEASDLIVVEGEVIQAAIDAANAGDVVLVDPGDYVQSDTRLINGEQVTACVFMKSGVDVQSVYGPEGTNIIPTGGPGIVGVVFDDVNGSTLSGFSVVGDQEGIRMRRGSGNSVYRCVVTGDDYAVALNDGEGGAHLTECVFPYAPDLAVSALNGSDVMLRECVFDGGWMGVHSSCSNPRIFECTFSNFLFNAINVIDLNNCAGGVRDEISDNVFVGNGTAISLGGPQGAEAMNVWRNTISRGTYGIVVEGAGSHVIARNTLYDQTNTGLDLKNGAAPSVSENIIVSSNYGVRRVGAGVATFTCNDVWGNTTANFSGLPDPTGTGGNIALDPEFCNAPAGDFRIDPLSPCAPCYSNCAAPWTIGAVDGFCGSSPLDVYPGDLLQCAVDNAPVGAVVRVHPGTFSATSTRVVAGQSITSCLFMKPGVSVESTGGAEVTTIGPPTPANGNAVVFSGNGGSSRLDGFHVSGGSNGIYVADDAVAEIENCVVSQSATGLYAVSGTTGVAQSSFEGATVRCVLSANGAEVSLDACDFRDSAKGVRAGGQGTIAISNCQFERITADGVEIADDASGAGSSVEASRFYQVGVGVNVEESAYGHPIAIVGNTFVGGERALSIEGGILGKAQPGSAVVQLFSHVVKSNTLFGQRTGGIDLGVGAAPQIHHNIVSQCGFGIRKDASSAPQLSCNDVWGSESANYVGLSDPTGTGGSISADPMFCDPENLNFSLAANSPCVAGVTTCTNPNYLGADGTTCSPMAPSVLHANGFETGDFHQAAGSEGNVTVTTLKRTGRYGLRARPIGPPPLTSYYRMQKPRSNDTAWDPIGLDRAYLTFYFRPTFGPSAVSEQMMSFTSAGGDKLLLAVRADGVLELREGDGTKTAAIEWIPNIYVRIDIACGSETSPGANDGTAMVRVNGGITHFFSGLKTRADAVDAIVFGPFASGEISSGAIYDYDDVVLSAGGWLQDSPGVVMLCPNADGTYPAAGGAGTDWLPSFGGLGRFPQVDDWKTVATDNDATYLANATTDGNVEFSVNLEATNPKVPANSAIVAVTSFAVLRDMAEISRVRLLTRSGGLDFDGGSNVDASAMYQPMMHLWTTNPNGNVAWTTAAVNELQVGLIDNSVQAHTLRCTAVGAIVLFTQGGLSGTSPNEESVLEARATEATHSIALRAWPNPTTLGSTSQFAFGLATPERVSLKIYDTSGRLVRTVVDEVLTAGAHQFEWDGRLSSGESVSPGVYLLRLIGADRDESAKLLRIR
ncbi:MAG: right-handed parallel beta-helix repeat-containing protein [bacterium]